MLKEFISRFFNKGNERTLKAKKSIFALLLVRGYGVIISMILIPIALCILGDYKYGIWITIFNVLSWIQIFDIGVGNGLRNKFSEAVALKDIRRAKEYVSTAYIIMGIGSVVLITLFVIPWYFINWAKVFNVDISLTNEISSLVGVTFAITAVQFSLKLIGTILTADHKPNLSAIIMALSNTFVLIIFVFFKDLLTGNLVLVGLVYTLIPAMISIIASLYLFNRDYKHVSPSFKFYDSKKVKEIFSLGSRFFIIQVAALIIFQTDALIISHTLSPEEVTPYNIVFRYFSVITMLVGIILTPFWSAFTEAKVNKDYKWISRIISNQVRGFGIICIIVIIFLFTAKSVIKIWIGSDMNFSSILLIGMALYTIIFTWNSIFASLLNGLGRTKLQIYTSVLGMVINIPLSIYLAKCYGSGGVIMATCISLLFFAVFGSLESFNILKLSES
ncbi:MAG: lipopolysaccharide biosynthesis protein [Bacteroidales bacterium]